MLVKKILRQSFTSTTVAILPVILPVFLLTAFGITGTLANPSSSKNSKDKIPTAVQQFKTAYKNFSKAKSYEVSVKVSGGISGSPDHKIKQFTLRQQYSGGVYGRIMETAEPKSFRTNKNGAGAMYDNGGWVKIQAVKKGKLLDRLFPFPMSLMTCAAKYSRKAVWLKDSQSASLTSSKKFSSKKKSDKKKVKKKKKKKVSKSKTYVKKKQSKKLRIPRTLRIEAPTKQALNHFVEVQNSGCMGGG